MKQYSKALYFIAICSLLSAFDAHAATCGEVDPCKIDTANGGSYYVSLPKNVTPTEQLAPFIFFHGHNGSGKGVMKNKGLLRDLHKAGFAVISPDGPLFNFRGRSVRGWAARHEQGTPRGGRNDVRFIENVLLDVKARLKLNIDNTVVAGFSSGGSMAWHFACYSNFELAGVVSVAGGLRRPLPRGGVQQPDGSIASTCSGPPRKLVHIHGFSDRQVPLEGRGIRAWHQGDVYEGLSVMRHTNQCKSRPTKIETKGAFWCRTWSDCGTKRPIKFCLHSGGHGMPRGWLKQGLDFIGKIGG